MPATAASANAEAAADSGGLAYLGLEQQATLLATREVSSRELVELSLERIEQAQPRLNAFRVVRSEQAIAAAATADRRLATGAAAPLLGVPVAIKDDVDLAEETTPFGCGGQHRAATRDAEVVRRLRAAGAIVVGKTHAPEVGQWHFTEGTFGATRNPWHTDHAPGGSSGGAAAAVAAGLVAAAVGSDGAGSIRIPAAWTGLVGLKPQRGRVSTWPDPEAFNGLSCYGPLTRSAGDAALLLDAIHGNVPADLHHVPAPAETFAESTAREQRPLRVALSFATPFGVSSGLDPEHRMAIEAVAERLAELGHEVAEADPDYGLVGPALVPRGMAGVEEWLRAHVEDRATLEPRTRTHGRIGRLLGGIPLRPLEGSRACAAAAGRPRLRPLRRRSHSDDRETTAPDRSPRGPRLLGDQLHGERNLPLCLRLERGRLAGDQHPGRSHVQRPADRGPVPGPRKRRGDAAGPGRLDRARNGWLGACAPPRLRPERPSPGFKIDCLDHLVFPNLRLDPWDRVTAP